MSKLTYWLDKIGASGVLLGPAETVGRVVSSGQYTGPEQLDEGIGILTGGLAAWNAAKYVDEREKRIKRSPLVHTGRGLEVAGTASTEIILQTGIIDDIYRALGSAALGIPIGAFLEYVAGPVHEKFSKKYRKD
jgi:hypothetical protein